MEFLDAVYNRMSKSDKDQAAKYINEYANKHMNELDRNDISGLAKEITTLRELAMIVKDIGIDLDQILNTPMKMGRNIKFKYNSLKSMYDWAQSEGFNPTINSLGTIDILDFSLARTDMNELSVVLEGAIETNGWYEEPYIRFIINKTSATRYSSDDMFELIQKYIPLTDAELALLRRGYDEYDSIEIYTPMNNKKQLDLVASIAKKLEKRGS